MGQTNGPEPSEVRVLIFQACGAAGIGALERSGIAGVHSLQATVLLEMVKKGACLRRESPPHGGSKAAACGAYPHTKTCA